MPHLIDLACFLTGRTPAAAAGFVRTANPDRTAPDGAVYPNTASDGAFALIDLGEGLIGKVTADGTRARNRCVYALAGETQRLVASGPDMLDLRLTFAGAEDAREIGADPARHPEAAAERPNIRLFLSLLDEFAQLIGGQAHECPTFADGLGVQRVLDAIGYGRALK
jgi:predicted dehydrogenase